MGEDITIDAQVEETRPVWQDVSPGGWLTSDVEAMRLQRSFRQAADTLTFKEMQQKEMNKVGAVAPESKLYGASILRSYAEEQRLMQENAMLRVQLDALRRQCSEESEWRRDARSMQTRLSDADAALAAAHKEFDDALRVQRKQGADMADDLLAAQTAEARLMQEVKRLGEELNTCKERLLGLQRVGDQAEKLAQQLERETAALEHCAECKERLQQQLSVAQQQLQTLQSSNAAKDAHIISLSKDADVAMTQCKALTVVTTDLTQRAERVAMLEERNSQLEKLMVETAAAREVLAKEVSVRDEEVHALQQRIHMLQEQATDHRRQLHAAHADVAALQTKHEDACMRAANLDASQLRLSERVRQLEDEASKLARELATSQERGTAAQQQLHDALATAARLEDRSKTALAAANRATKVLESTQRLHASDARTWHEHELALREHNMALRSQLTLREDVLGALEKRFHDANTRCARSERERDEAKVACSLLEEQMAARVQASASMAKRVEATSVSAAGALQAQASAEVRPLTQKEHSPSLSPAHARSLCTCVG
jgi:chromosome segregation ATPase